MTPEQKLVEAIRAAAEAYCAEAKQTFDVAISFAEISTPAGPQGYTVASVMVETTKRTWA